MKQLVILNKAKMEVRKGELVMIKSGKPSKYYIKRWQKTQAIADGTPVRVITEEHLDRLIADANLSRNWGA